MKALYNANIILVNNKTTLSQIWESNFKSVKYCERFLNSNIFILKLCKKSLIICLQYERDFLIIYKNKPVNWIKALRYPYKVLWFFGILCANISEYYSIVARTLLTTFNFSQEIKNFILLITLYYYYSHSNKALFQGKASLDNIFFWLII